MTATFINYCFLPAINAVARIREAIMLRKKSCLSILAGLTLLLGLLGGGVGYAQDGSAVAEIIAIMGQAEVKAAGASWRAAQLRDKLQIGDTVRTQEQSRAKLLFMDDSVTVLGEKTTLEISRFLMDARTKERTGLLKAVEGRLRFLIQQIPGAPAPAITIESAVLAVGVRGTDGILETGSWHKVYLLESAEPLTVKHKVTGQIMKLWPGQFLTADAKGPMQINPITPDILDSLIKQFRLTYDFTPKNLVDPGAPPDIAALQEPGTGLVNPLPPVIQQPLPLLHSPKKFQGFKPAPPSPGPSPRPSPR
jgi:hypothetical protein